MAQNAPAKMLANVPRPRGRSIYVDSKEDIIAEVCERLSEGETLMSICRDDNMPAHNTLWAWMQSDPLVAEAIHRAREAGGDMIALDALRIIDGDEGYGSGDTQRDKARADTRLRLLAKWHPKRYGDSVQLKHADADGQKLDTAPLVQELLALARSGAATDKAG